MCSAAANYLLKVLQYQCNDTQLQFLTHVLASTEMWNILTIVGNLLMFTWLIACMPSK